MVESKLLNFSRSFETDIMQKLIDPAVEENILKNIPQQKPFRFIDEIIDVNEDGCIGTYTFKQDEFFYEGHFPGDPVTPGVILTECMAQIGLVSLALFILKDSNQKARTLFTSSEVNFRKIVTPGQKVVVKSKKKYFRMKKLCCEVVMETTDGDLICSGVLSGMFITT